MDMSKENFLKMVNDHEYVKLKFQKMNGMISEKIASFKNMPYADQERNRLSLDDSLIFKSKDDHDEYRTCYFKNIIDFALL